jgi:hypothetical protein
MPLLTRADRTPNIDREETVVDGFDVAGEVLRVECRHFVRDPSAGRRHVPADLLGSLYELRARRPPEDAR